jgi:hypothetical protein
VCAVRGRVHTGLGAECLRLSPGSVAMRSWLGCRRPEMLIIMETGQWIVVALDSIARVGGCFPTGTRQRRLPPTRRANVWSFM